MSTKNKILYIIAILVIIAGIVVWKLKGFNLELQYSTRDQLNLNNNTAINTDEVRQIVSETLGNTGFIIQQIETFGNSVSIVAKDITDEQKSQIIQKFNEKNGTELKTEEIQINSIPLTRVKDVIRPYVIPGIIITLIILGYFYIRFSGLDKRKIIAKTIIYVIGFELLLYSIIAITRIPFGRVAVASGIALYAIVITWLTSKFENEKEDNIAKEQK